MSNITTQNRIARQLDRLMTAATEGLSMLQHFDYPETWSCLGNTTLSPSAKFGKNCVYFPDTSSKTAVTNTTGMFNLSPFGDYEAECFVKASLPPSDYTYDLMDFDGLSLNLTDEGKVQLASEAWNILKVSNTAIEADIWHHILLRITGSYAYVFVDGVLALKAGITGSNSITPESVTLGGYVGYMDEFAFRRNADTEAPTVPTSAYEMGTSTIERVPTVNAPVTRAVWCAEDLPDGLKLSESGVLTGHPTTAGIYECSVTVSTNWGTTNKNIRIVIQ